MYNCKVDVGVVVITWVCMMKDLGLIIILVLLIIKLVIIEIYTEKSVCKNPYVISVCKLPTTILHTDFVHYIRIFAVGKCDFSCSASTVLMFENASFQGWCTNVEDGLSLEREIVG